MDIKLNQRRINAKERLEAQLKKGKKPTKDRIVELDANDKKRIEKEIEILKSKIILTS
jgi:hypothetical protein